MNSKAKFKKNLTRLVCLILAGVMLLGSFAYFTMDESAMYSYSDGLTKEGFFEGVTALDNVVLPDYKAYTMPEEHTVATDDEVAAKIASIQESFAKQEKDADTTRAIVDKDTVNIDYVGTVDGVEFEGGNTKGAGADLTIGSKTYIDDFEEQLIGAHPGDTVEVKVTFPENYGKEELNGKDAVFTVTVNGIYE